MTDIGFPNDGEDSNINDQIDKILDRIFEGSETNEDEREDNESKRDTADIQIPFVAIEKKEGEEWRRIIIDPTRL